MTIKMTKQGIIPFSNGTEFAEWENHNCGNCWKGSINRDPDKTNFERFNCKLDKALGMAYLDDGLIPLDVAKRLGWTEQSGQIKWNCPELEKDRPPRPRRAPKVEDTPLFKST